MGRPRLRRLRTRQHRGRGPHGYLDLDYWADMDRSVYRPQWTLDELLQAPSFTLPEPPDRPDVPRGRQPGDGRRRARGRRRREHTSPALVLAAGTFGTARIVLRSVDRYETRIPMVCNAYAYVPMLNLAACLPRRATPRHQSLTRDTDCDGRAAGSRAAVAGVLVPLAPDVQADEGMPRRSRTVRRGRSSAPDADVRGPGHHHEDRRGRKYCVLHRGAPDRLEIGYKQSPPRSDDAARRRRLLLGFMRKLGCVPLKTIRPATARGLHHGGTFPIVPESDDPSRAIAASQLRATRAVCLPTAPSSVAPAEGLTFNIVAERRRVRRAPRRLIATRRRAATSSLLGLFAVTLDRPLLAPARRSSSATMRREYGVLQHVLANGPDFRDQLQVRFGGWAINYVVCWLLGVSRRRSCCRRCSSVSFPLMSYVLLVRWGYARRWAFLGGLLVATAPFEVVLGRAAR